MKKKTFKEILTKDFLLKEYVENEKTAYEIAKEFKFSVTTILRYLHKYEITIRGRLRKDLELILTKKYLIENYVIKKLSLGKIAKQLNCSRNKISSKLIQFNIPKRNRSEAMVECSGENSHNYNPECHKTYYCIEPDCNNEITYRAWKTCSGRCLSCSAKEQLKDPKKNPMFDKNHTKEARRKISLGHGGTGIPYENAKYPAEFNDELRLYIRTRDNNICQGCGITEEEHLIKHKKVLIVHHIDHIKENCDKTNLITVCCVCNRKADKKADREYWETYYKQKINLIYKEIKCQ